MNPVPGKRLALGCLAIGQVLAMALWFSATAVAPQLAAEWGLEGARQAWLTMSVQLGFVAGALAIALLNLADRLDAGRLVAVSALAGAALTAAIPALGVGLAGALALRFATGAALAGVYPPAMKLVSTWCREDRGAGIGLLIGALTIGTAMPHLIDALAPAGAAGLPPWPVVLYGAAGCALVGSAVVFVFVRPGPYHSGLAPFRWRFMFESLRDRATRLANFGYLGHMWELYAMWAWVPLMLVASYEAAGWSREAGRLAGFAAVAAGAAGCVAAGLAADRIGRTTITIASLAVSGACSLVAGLAFGNPTVLTAICIVWGIAVVADSAQFSAAVSELGDPRYVGTALTVQTSLGFLLTTVTIQAIPPLLDVLGWRWTFAVLALGPAFGIGSMLALRRMPEAARMAGGRR